MLALPPEPVEALGVVEEVGEDARDEASRVEVGEAKEEARQGGVKGVGVGPQGGGVEEGEEEGLGQEAKAPEPRHEEALEKPPEEDLLPQGGGEGEGEAKRGPCPRAPKGQGEVAVQGLGLAEGGGEEAAEEGLEALEGGEEDQSPKPRPARFPGEGEAKPEHPAPAHEEEPPLEGEEEEEGGLHPCPRAKPWSKSRLG